MIIYTKESELCSTVLEKGGELFLEYCTLNVGDVGFAVAMSLIGLFLAYGINAALED